MTELSQDEVSVLLIAREGQHLIPIGRWAKSILALTARGLMLRYDDVNYVITDIGRQAIEQRDQEDFDALREAQKRMVERQQYATLQNTGPMWMGRYISDLSRAELEDAFIQVVERYTELLSPDNSKARALGMVEMLKRGENG